MHSSGGDSNDVDGINDVVGAGTNDDYDDICGDGSRDWSSEENQRSKNEVLFATLSCDSWVCSNRKAKTHFPCLS